ncbi:MAG TPA: hypothetical protein VK832_10700, partial [Burkholderiaceae bacterium]|nr:hypothetical protein [Burkholderiaceae bacterium]
EQQMAIQLALKETFAMEILVKFETAPSLVCGVELSMNGQKLAWSIDDYLSSLDKRMNEILTPTTKAETENNPKIIPVPATSIQPTEVAGPAKTKSDITASAAA